MANIDDDKYDITLDIDYPARRRDAETKAPPPTIWVHKHMHGYDNPVEVSRPICDIEDYHEYQLTPAKK
jgi:hypothetical protein